MFSWFFFSCFFVILQNPVQLVSALRLGDILIIGEKKRVEGRREEKRSFPLLPSVKTLHPVPWLSSVPHLNLTETRQADYYCIYAIEVKHHELKENSTNFIHKHQFTSNGKCYPVKPAVCQENDPSDVIVMSSGSFRLGDDVFYVYVINCWSQTGLTGGPDGSQLFGLWTPLY